jgi:CHAD domain-containing protein
MKMQCARAQLFARRSLRDRFRTLRRHVGAASTHNVDGVHDLRVASRRLRAVLMDHSQYFDRRPLKAFLKQVKLITRGLGDARELDVTLRLLRDWSRRLPVTFRPAIKDVERQLRAHRRAEANTVEMICSLASSRNFSAHYDCLIDSMYSGKRCIMDSGAATLRKRSKSLSKAIKTWRGDPSDERLHAVRIAFKKLRYTCEILQPHYGESMNKFIAEIKNVQETLGAWNDQRMLRARIVGLADGQPACAETLALFIERLDEETSRLLDTFVDSAGPWIEKKSRRKLFDEIGPPVISCCTARTRI